MILPEATLPSVGKWITLDALDEGVECLCANGRGSDHVLKKKSMYGQKFGVWMKELTVKEK